MTNLDDLEQIDLRDRFQNNDLESNSSIFTHLERSVDLSVARTSVTMPDWAGNFLYVAELKGTLKIRFNHANSPLITLSQGDVYRLNFRHVILTNAANAFWGTAKILVGMGAFDLDPASGSRRPIVVYSGTGALAVALNTTEARRFKLISATVHFSAAPTTSELLTLTKNAISGAAYDTVLEDFDPSLAAMTDVVFTPDCEWIFQAGDELNLAYANTDTVTYGAEITVEPV